MAGCGSYWLLMEPIGASWSQLVLLVLDGFCSSLLAAVGHHLSVSVGIHGICSQRTAFSSVLTMVTIERLNYI